MQVTVRVFRELHGYHFVCVYASFHFDFEGGMWI